eukprot:268679_1
MESMSVGIGDEEYEYDDDLEVYYDNLKQEIAYLQSEYAYQLSCNSEFIINKDKKEIEARRRTTIISYYDNYIYDEYTFTNNNNYNKTLETFKQNLDTSINEDYNNILLSIRNAEFKRLQQEEMKQPNILYQPSAYDDYFKINQPQNNNINNIEISPSPPNNNVLIPPPPPNNVLIPPPPPNNNVLIPPPPPNNNVLIPPPPPAHARPRRKSVEHMNQSNLLYKVDPNLSKKEKQWMKQLKIKKFKIYLNSKKYQTLQIQRIEMESKMQEIKTQTDIKTKLNIMEELHRKVDKYTDFRIEYVKNINEEINSLRDTINMLMSRCTNKVNII